MSKKNETIEKVTAKELIDRYIKLNLSIDKAKECSLIVINEIMLEARWMLYNNYEKRLEFWQKVKQEIENI